MTINIQKVQFTTAIALSLITFTGSVQAKLMKPTLIVSSFVIPASDPKHLLWQQQVETFILAGLTRDHSQIPNMFQSLKTDYQPAMTETITLALARMGAVEALPAIDDLLAHGYVVGSLKVRMSEPTAQFVRAARARLLAETEATPHAQVVRFFQEIGETPVQMNAVIQKFEQKQNDSASQILPEDPYREETAEDELADMIYHGSAVEMLGDPYIGIVDFSHQPYAALKIKIALLTPEEQRRYLIDALSHSDHYSFNDAGQLLLELGRPEAVVAITTKLEEMDADRKNYEPDGFRQLFCVLYLANHHVLSPILIRFEHDSDPKIVDAVHFLWALRDMDEFKYGY
jgi:hypothetical protein